MTTVPSPGVVEPLLVYGIHNDFQSVKNNGHLETRNSWHELGAHFALVTAVSRVQQSKRGKQTRTKLRRVKLQLTSWWEGDAQEHLARYSS